MMTMQTNIGSDGPAKLYGRETSILFRALGQNRILIFFVFSYLFAAGLVSAAISDPIHTIQPKYLMWMLISVVPIFLLSMVLWRFGNMVLNVKPEKPIYWLARDLRHCLISDRERVLSGFIAAFSIVFFAAVFSYVKDSIPQMNPFSWDPTFAHLDRMLHGGYDPYVLLAPVFGNPLMTKLADSAYSLWFLLIYFFAFTACMDKENPTRRNRFLFAFFLSWIIGGSILATIFSSVGPVYYQDFGFGDQFMPLVDRLHEIGASTSLTALELQAALLDGYQNNGKLTGISAMPSMHLALAWLIAFQSFQYRRVFGWVMIGFALMIQFSSVHLGWHYAVDGYLGFGVAIICWFAASWLAKLQNRFDTKASG